MKSSNKTMILNHNAKDLFDIVLDLESYPEFIPWCHNMKIYSKNTKEIYADMYVLYKFIYSHTQLYKFMYIYIHLY